MNRPKLQWFLAAVLLINLCVVLFGLLTGSVVLKGNPILAFLLVAVPSALSIVALYLFFIRKRVWLTATAILYLAQLIYVTSEGRGLGFRFGLAAPFRISGDPSNGIFLNLLAAVLLVVTLVAIRKSAGSVAAPGRSADA